MRVVGTATKAMIARYQILYCRHYSGCPICLISFGQAILDFYRERLCFRSYSLSVDSEHLAIAHQHFSINDDRGDVLLVGYVNQVRNDIVGRNMVHVIERDLNQVRPLADFQ